MDNIAFMVGKKTILRPLNKDTDLLKCVEWINSPEVRQFVYNTSPYTIAKETKWFDSMDNLGDYNFAVVDKNHNKYIGNISIHKIDSINRTAETGTLIGERNYWGKGFGTDAKMLILYYAFNVLNLRKITSSVFEFNERSYNYSKKCGYKEEGRRKEQYMRNGRYIDEILLAVFKEDWQPLWDEYVKGFENIIKV